MRDERDVPDEVIGALVRRLQVTPASDPRARAAILARVRGRRQAPWRTAFAMAWQPSVPLMAAAAVVVAALGVGYVGRVLVEPGTTLANAPEQVTPELVTPELVTPELIPVSNDGRVPKTFVLNQPSASSVTLVGDFNGWGEKPTVLKDPSGTGVWTVTVMLPPGRHSYAFLVNDSVWTADPRVSSLVDADFGRATSVILVPER